METRLLVIAVLAAAVVAVALATRRWQRPAHRPIDLGERSFPPGYVIFTSTECANCKQAIRVLEATAMPIREVTWELEPKVIEELGVESVPLTILVDPAGTVVAQTVGVPRRGWVRRTSR